MMQFPALFPAVPEIYLACLALLMLMVGAFRGDRGVDILHISVVLAFVSTAAMMFLTFSHGPERQVGLFGLFVLDPFALVLKSLILLGASLAVMMGLRTLKDPDMGKAEYPVLVTLSVVGMMMMVSANDMMSLYLGLELQSLCLYVLAAFRRDHAPSSEAGLKYFVLGALSSGILLYGVSLIYGYAGSTSFDVLAHILSTNTPVSPGVTIGLVLILAGLAFKIAAAPFHMWSPDVYQGAPTPVTAFFALAPKVAAVGLLIRVLWGPFEALQVQWQQVVMVLSALSMIVGALGALRQNNIKRLMAYSSIGHVGYILMGLAAGTEGGLRGVFVYLFFYVLMSAGTFAVILCIRRHGKPFESMTDLAGLAKTHTSLAFAMLLFMFSMAGIPPTAGFLAKLFIFQAAMDGSTAQPLLLYLAVLGVLTSVVAAYYYLRIIKTMWLDEPAGTLDPVHHLGLRAVLLGTALAIFPVFIVVVSPYLDIAAWASKAVMGGP